MNFLRDLAKDYLAHAAGKTSPEEKGKRKHLATFGIVCIQRTCLRYPKGCMAR